MRLPDGIYGGTRPADGLLFGCKGTMLIEFKVCRTRGFSFDVNNKKHVTKHQLESLRKFVGQMRISCVGVFHEDCVHFHFIDRLGRVYLARTMKDRDPFHLLFIEALEKGDDGCVR